MRKAEEEPRGLVQRRDSGRREMNMGGGHREEEGKQEG